MPHIVFITLMGALGIVAARALARQRQEAESRVREAQRSNAARPITSLVQDPVTGIYYPARRD